MRIIRVGDTVTARLYGNKFVTGKILDIEITRADTKYGRSVRSCNLDKHQNGVVDLDCNHWCYFYQIESIETRNGK